MTSSKSILKIAISICVFIVVLQPLRAQDIGVIAFVKGDVSLDGQLAEDGDAVRSRSVVVIKRGSCSLLIGEETVIHLNDNTVFKLTEYTADSEQEIVKTSLEYGEVHALIGSTNNKKKSFKVKTRQSEMGIRGSQVWTLSPRDPNKPAKFLAIEGDAYLDFEDSIDGGGGKLGLSDGDSVEEGEGGEVRKQDPDVIQDTTNKIDPGLKDYKDVDDITGTSRESDPDVEEDLTFGDDDILRDDELDEDANDRDELDPSLDNPDAGVQVDVTINLGN
jgi:hypothetical protein